MPKKVEKSSITAKRITSLRKHAALTQRELAEKMGGISAGLIKLMETDRARITEATMKKYTDFFHCSAEYITGAKAVPYSDAMQILMSLPDVMREELMFQGDLRALITRKISAGRISTLAFQGRIDEDELFSRAYDHMIRFVEDELRKAEAAGDVFEGPLPGAAKVRGPEQEQEKEQEQKEGTL